MDAHSSVNKEFRVHTIQGAVISLATVIAIGYLIYTELAFNFTTTIVEHVHVNASTPRGLEMEFDITFPNIACALLSVDANDPTGQKQSLHLDATHHVWKHRMSAEGYLIGKREKLELGSTLLSDDHLKEVAVAAGAKEGEQNAGEKEEEDGCGSCYGAGEEGECCNTCDDVKRAYSVKGWVLANVEDIAQCKNQWLSKDEDGEGCNVHGKVALSTGGGNLHLAPSRQLEKIGNKQEKTTIFDFFLRTFEEFNVSHTIHKLRFGEEYPGHVHQLDNEIRDVDVYGMYQYYIQVVPTVYRYLNGTTIHTNQFSVTEHLRKVNPGSGRGLPGVFFFYDVSSLHVEIEEYRRGWVQFFTSVCAIVGGVVTIMGMLDQFLYSTVGQKSHDLIR